MIRRGIKVRLAVFTAISVVLILYVGGNYVGLTQYFFGGPYTVTVQIPSSGGIFTNAEVTDRGVPVGRVGALHLTDNGVAVDLRIDAGKKIPVDSAVVVADRSAVGEQYVDLQPRTSKGPYLHDGSVLHRPNATLPVDVPTVLGDLDALATSIGRPQLKTLVDELGDAFAGTGPDLARLADTTTDLVHTLTEAMPDTTRLLQSSRTVLDTQVASAGALQDFSRNLGLLTDALRQHDTDLRLVIQRGAPAAQAVNALLKDNEEALPVLLHDLTDIGGILAQKDRLAGTELVLVALPRMVQDTFNVARGDGTARLGLVLDYTVGVCTKGYESSGPLPVQTSTKTGLMPQWKANLDAYCAEPPGSPIGVRGAQNLPRPPGDPTRYPAGAGADPVDHSGPVPTPPAVPSKQPGTSTQVPADRLPGVDPTSLSWLLLAPAVASAP